MGDIFVKTYSRQTLRELIREHSENSETIICNMLQTEIIEEYFSNFQYVTIVIENEYIDRDYLEDFAGYYVRCFNDYERKCTRLHFFKCAFCEDDLTILLKGKESFLNQCFLQEHYLGFIVIKKLPRTFIGRTCLSIKAFNTTAYTLVHRKYAANLFGIQLTVDSVAFQEQDTVVAACATCALWFALHKTSESFNHQIPSPMEITKAANRYFPTTSRAFPNHGLLQEQIPHAIQEIGLAPSMIGVKHPLYLKFASYAHLKGGIPVILTLDMIDPAIPIKRPRNLLGDLDEDMDHAVTLTGYKLGGDLKSASEELNYTFGDANYDSLNEGEGDDALVSSEIHPDGKYCSKNEIDFRLTAARMTAFRAHDDQAGPYVEMIFDDIPAWTAKGKQCFSLSTRWHSKITGHYYRAIPVSLIIPLYNKIRIPFNMIYRAVKLFDVFIKACIPQKIIDTLEWDIFLITNSKFKEEIIGNRMAQEETRKSILLKSMPRFLWRATAKKEEEMILDLIFDATDIEQGACLILAIEYNDWLFRIIKHKARNFQPSSLFEGTAAWNILKYFQELV